MRRLRPQPPASHYSESSPTSTKLDATWFHGFQTGSCAAHSPLNHPAPHFLNMSSYAVCFRIFTRPPHAKEHAFQRRTHPNACKDAPRRSASFIPHLNACKRAFRMSVVLIPHVTGHESRSWNLRTRVRFMTKDGLSA